MLRMALALLSTAQFGARIKDSVERGLRQAAIAAVAVVFLIAAAVFALIATYHVLVSSFQFTPAEAAAIMAGSLLLVGVLMLALAPRVGQAPRKAAPTPAVAAGQTMGMIDQTVGQAVQQIGPVNLVAIAFLAGLFAGRR
jgi:hypothetical protein